MHAQVFHLAFYTQHGRELKFGANLNRFEDINVDLNAGVSAHWRVLSASVIISDRFPAGWMRLSRAPHGLRTLLDGLMLPQGAEMTGYFINTGLYGNMQDKSIT